MIVTCLFIESSVIVPLIKDDAEAGVFESRDLIADLLEQPEVS